MEYLGVSMRKRSSSSSSYITAMMVAREEAGLLFANLLGQMQMLHASMHPFARPSSMAVMEEFSASDDVALVVKDYGGGGGVYRRLVPLLSL